MQCLTSFRPNLSKGFTCLWVGTALILLCVAPSIVGLAQISVRGELTHEFVVEPGQRYEGEIVIANTSAGVAEVQASQTDYLFFATGENSYGKPGTLARSNAPWITLFLPPRLNIAPKETISLHYTIDVPDDLSLAGTYWSMIMVMAAPPPAKEEEEGQMAIRQVFRYGIQIVTHIGDSGERNIRIMDVKLISEEEGPVLQLDVENTGERWVRPMAWAELYDEQGATVGRFESSQLRIYPGCSVRHRFVLSEVPSGAYKALVVFDNNDEYVWGAQYDLEL